jgi:hypothetical protein
VAGVACSAIEAARLLGRDRTRVYALLRSGGLASGDQPFSERALGLLEHPEELVQDADAPGARTPDRRGASAAAASQHSTSFQTLLQTPLPY